MVGATASGASDNGKWWIDGNKLCRQWNSWSGAKKSCVILYQNGEKLRFESPETKQSISGRVAR